jgi:hypothetical protein
MALQVMLVEPRPDTRSRLRHAASAVADIGIHSSFQTARRSLEDGLSIDFLITNVQLGDYNGLVLVAMAAARGVGRSIVFTDVPDVTWAKLAQHAGAFYETQGRLAVTLGAYLRAALPPQDRRDVSLRDRRTLNRGGRRSWDKYLMAGTLRPLRHQRVRTAGVEVRPLRVEE